MVRMKGETIHSVTQLTEHFSLEELCHSSMAKAKGIANKPNDDQLANLQLLAQALEAVRRAVGDRPVTVLSGFRSPKVNALVGGSKTSAHMDGLAADIVVSGLSPFEVATAILGDDEVWFDQLIHYPGRFVHFGIADSPRSQVLTGVSEGGKKTYRRGLHEQAA